MPLPERPHVPGGLPTQPPPLATAATSSPVWPAVPVAPPAGVPQTPAPASPAEQGGYQAVGALTADQLLYGSADQFAHLDDKIVQVRDWLQTWLTNHGYAERIAEARSDPAKKAELAIELDRTLVQYLSKESIVAAGRDRNILIASVINEILGLGPIEPLWTDRRITEVMVNGPEKVYVEIDGKLTPVPGARFRSREHLLEVCTQILMPLNRRVDHKNPLADGRLPDGSRVNIVHHCLSPQGPILTIRRFPETVWTLADLVDNGSLTEEMACELAFLVHHKCSVVVVGGTGAGKALDVDTPIPTPEGFRRMGDLIVGDQVFGLDGRPYTVRGVYDQLPNRSCFEVVFSDGSTLVADADHLWQVYTPDGWSGVVTTAHLHKVISTGQTRYVVPALGGPVQYPTRTLPLPPYLLGLWLTAGAPGDARLPEGNHKQAQAYTDTGWGIEPDGTVPGLREVLEQLEILHRPRIPNLYLCSDLTSRRQLLAGLAAGAGVDVETGRIVVRDRQVADDVHSLVCSLGYHATTHPHPSGWLVHYHTGKVERQIVQINPVVSRPVRCITVDSPDHLYLAGRTYIPTHNTSLLNALSSCIPRHERVITVEDSLELRLHPDAHVVALEARPAAASGEGEVRIRDLVRNALRMRPDRIIVGEVRDASALDMLQAMNTGHEGSMTTVHANGAAEAINRLGVLVAQGGEIPEDKVSWLIGDAVDLMVVQTRYEDGSRRVSGIYEISHVEATTVGHEPHSRAGVLDSPQQVRPIPLWEWEQTGVDDTGKFTGRWVRRNHLSDELVRHKRLDHFQPFSMQDVRRMSELSRAKGQR